MVENSHFSHLYSFSGSSMVGGETPLSLSLSLSGSSRRNGGTWAILGWVPPNWLCCSWCSWDRPRKGKFGGKFGKFVGKFGGRLGNNPDPGTGGPSDPFLEFFGPLLLPNTSITGSGLGDPSLLSTMAGLWAYFFRWSFRE